MPIASFGKKVFQVSSRKVDTIGSLVWSGAIDSEAQEKLQNKPSTYIKGLGLTQMSFEIPLKTEFGHNIRAEIESWENMRDRRNPELFFLGNKPLGKNKWLLKSVVVSETVINGKGDLISAKIKIELEEYVRAGSKPPDTNASAGLGISLNLTPNSYVVDPPDKAARKRANQNYEVAMRTAFEASARGLS